MDTLNKNTLEFVSEFEKIIAWGTKLRGSLTEELFNKKPAPKSWSAGECIQHLNVTAELYLPNIDSAIENARRKNQLSNEEFKARFIYGKMIKSLEPPYKRKMKTFKSFMPQNKLNFESTIAEFERLNWALIDKVKESNGINLNIAVLVSPVSKLVRLKLGEAFLLLTTHARRHLWQAEQAVG
jgi:hypothetical protein